jgi:RNA polymerase sigma-70 factor, ECF subfamily
VSRTAARADAGAEPTDAAVVRAVVAGDRERYVLLVSRYQALLYRHALGMVGDADAAADLVQDSFVKGYTSLDRCGDPSRFGAWIYRILRNRCLDYLKDRRRQTVPLEETSAFAAETDHPEVRLDNAELRRSVGSALAALPTAQREAFLLKHVDGRSYDEMSELLGASVSALKMRVLRAREAMQQMLDGGRPSDGPR